MGARLQTELFPARGQRRDAVHWLARRLAHIRSPAGRISFSASGSSRRLTDTGALPISDKELFRLRSCHRRRREMPSRAGAPRCPLHSRRRGVAQFRGKASSRPTRATNGVAGPSPAILTSSGINPRSCHSMASGLARADCCLRGRSQRAARCPAAASRERRRRPRKRSVRALRPRGGQ